MGAEIIAYYPFEETTDLATAIDWALNFDAVARPNRVAGYCGLALECLKTVANFNAAMLLDEIPSTLKFTVEFWFKLTEALARGEHSTYTIFSKRWAAGIRLDAFFVTRLETVVLKCTFNYVDTNGTPRAEEYEIACGELAANVWRKVYIILDLRTDYLSKFGIYLDAAYAAGDTAYLVDIPEDATLNPFLYGGDSKNFLLGSSDLTVPYIANGKTLPTDHRLGITGLIDDVVVSSILKKPTHGTERPKLILSSQGLGSAVAAPVKADYDFGEHVALTATADYGAALVAWMVDGVDMGSTNPYDLIMTPGDKTVIAVFDGQVATPTVDIPAGDYGVEQLVELSCSTAGAAIYYTTNGDTPDAGDTLYTVPISIAAGMTLKAIGILGGQADSDVMSKVYTFTLPAPIFNPDGGDPDNITMTDIMVGVTIRYTVDGSEPDSGDATYATPVTVTTGTTLKAKAFKTNCTTSATKSALYVATDWTRKTDFGGDARYFPVGIAIGAKAYVGTGINQAGTVFFKDWWEYNPATNAWTQKADFGGVARQYAMGFNIGAKGYLGSGYTVSPAFYYDFWEYDPATDIWTQKADCPDAGLSNYWPSHFCFSDGASYGYFGDAYYGRFYQYNPGTDAWTQKANFPGATRVYPTAVFIGAKGYVGLGHDLGSPQTDYKDWYEYNPTLNTWTAKTSFPGQSAYYIPVFASATACYLMGGLMKTGNPGDLEFWKYTPGTDTWLQLTNLPFFGGVGTGFVVSNKGYVFGHWAGGVPTKELRKYNTTL